MSATRTFVGVLLHMLVNYPRSTCWVILMGMAATLVALVG